MKCKSLVIHIFVLIWNFIDNSEQGSDTSVKYTYYTSGSSISIGLYLGAVVGVIGISCCCTAICFAINKNKRATRVIPVRPRPATLNTNQSFQHKNLPVRSNPPRATTLNTSQSFQNIKHGKTPDLDF